MAEEGTLPLLNELATRFRAPAGDAAGRYRLRVAGIVRDVVVEERACRLEAVAGRPDAELVTDAPTWARWCAGETSLLEGALAGRLQVRGSIDRALRFEPLFARSWVSAQSAGFIRRTADPRDAIDMAGVMLKPPRPDLARPVRA